MKQLVVLFHNHLQKQMLLLKKQLYIILNIQLISLNQKKAILNIKFIEFLKDYNITPFPLARLNTDDFSFQPAINEEALLIKKYKKATNIVFIKNHCIKKTHLLFQLNMK